MDISSEAKLLISLSLDADGFVSADRVRAVCAYIENNGEYSDKIAILKEFSRRLKPLLHGMSAKIETSGELSEAAQEKLSEKIRRVAGSRVGITTEVNRALIGGVRVKIGDDIFERSVSEELSELELF